GTVTFFDGATNIGTGTLSGNTATFTTSALTTGSHNITATYNGDATHSASTSPVLVQVVNAAPPVTTTTTITSSINPSTAGQSVTFTATVSTGTGTPTGTVTFFDGATNIGTGTLSGNTATFTTSALTTGSHNITATYNGDATHSASTSAVLTQVVNAAPPATTTTTLTSSLNPSTFGQSVTFTATISTGTGTPTGTVTFFDGATNIGTGTLSGNTATFTTTALTTGSHNITATYNGDATHSASTSAVLTQVVNAPPPATTTTTLTSSLNPSTFGQSVTFTATVSTGTGTPTGTVSFLDGTTNIGTGTLSGNTATFTTSSLNVGSHNITATYNGDATHSISTSAVVTQLVMVPLIATTISVTSSLNPSSTGRSIIFTATVSTTSGTPTGTITFFDGSTNIGSVTLTGNTATFTTSSLTAGSHNITATYNGDAAHTSSTSALLVQYIIIVGSVKQLHIYPNPVTDGVVYLQMRNMLPGNYTIRLINDLGQVLLTQQIAATGNSTEQITIGKRTKGVYQLELIKPDNSKITNKIIIY
ncbi:MAG TPA: Ig-like domain repeat protein, partial [Chitinophagaceae bacterium]|nr:Ig-like domain repeat protein [Chitinophagaceae bacterium]